MSAPASKNMSFKLHATRHPATARETGVMPKEASMSTLATRPCTEVSIRCMIQADSQHQGHQKNYHAAPADLPGAGQ